MAPLRPLLLASDFAAGFPSSEPRNIEKDPDIEIVDDEAGTRPHRMKRILITRDAIK
jgi:hypothetical protein